MGIGDYARQVNPRFGFEWSSYRDDASLVFPTEDRWAPPVG
jgi:hypothetical protein